MEHAVKFNNMKHNLKRYHSIDMKDVICKMHYHCSSDFIFCNITNLYSYMKRVFFNMYDMYEMLRMYRDLNRGIETRGHIHNLRPHQSYF